VDRIKIINGFSLFIKNLSAFFNNVQCAQKGELDKIVKKLDVCMHNFNARSIHNNDKIYFRFSENTSSFQLQ
jgi:hypothetical protein